MTYCKEKKIQTNLCPNLFQNGLPLIRQWKWPYYRFLECNLHQLLTHIRHEVRNKPSKEQCTKNPQERVVGTSCTRGPMEFKHLVLLTMFLSCAAMAAAKASLVSAVFLNAKPPAEGGGGGWIDCLG